MFEESGARPLRVFFALPLPDDLGRTVATLQRTLERKARGLRWTPVENVHVTLKFLGNVQASDVRVLSEGLEQLTAGLPALTARATALGAFPSTRRARVFVLELGEPGGRIAELAKALDELAGRVGVLAETRPFRAHVTLARARPPLDSSRAHERVRLRARARHLRPRPTLPFDRGSSGQQVRRAPRVCAPRRRSRAVTAALGAAILVKLTLAIVTSPAPRSAASTG